MRHHRGTVFHLATFYTPQLHTVLAVAGLLLYVLITHIGRQQRLPSAAIAWVLAIVGFPYLGVPLFLLFGTRKLTRPRPPVRAPVSAAADPGVVQAPWTRSLLAALDILPAVGNASAVFHADGAAALDALLRLCDSASRRLDVCIFILGDDEVGARACEALAGAAARGVRTRLLIDAIGSLQANRGALRRLRRAGVQVLAFMPLVHSPLRGRTNLRNHRKLAIADTARLWAGGRNLAVEYFIDREGLPAWVDLSFVVEGELASAAQLQFDRDWRSAGGKDAAPPTAQRPAWPAATAHAAQWIPTGPDRSDDTVYTLLLAAAHHARHRILAVTPYLVPDEVLLDAWCLACRRGVDMCVVLPARSNHRLADLARRRAVRRLLAAGARIQLVDGMVHAKAVVIDDDLALCGSANLDGRSLLLNYEVMAAFHDRGDIQWLANWIAVLHAGGRPHRVITATLAEELLEGITRAVGFQL